MQHNCVGGENRSKNAGWVCVCEYFVFCFSRSFTPNICFSLRMLINFHQMTSILSFANCAWNYFEIIHGNHPQNYRFSDVRWFHVLAFLISEPFFRSPKVSHRLLHRNERKKTGERRGSEKRTKNILTGSHPPISMRIKIEIWFLPARELLVPAELRPKLTPKAWVSSR